MSSALHKLLPDAVPLSPETGNFVSALHRLIPNAVRFSLETGNFAYFVFVEVCDNYIKKKLALSS